MSFFCQILGQAREFAQEEKTGLKTLIVEDDFTSRKVLQLMLLPFGECDIAVNGMEALAAFRGVTAEGKSYDLICLDIMMPGMDGHTVLREIRRLEGENGIFGRDCVKVVMTTALSDSKNILQSFNEQCESYFVKPFNKSELLGVLRNLGLVP
jgi:two-component system, chemotaxis family, chemotaxis protein CheY